MTHRHEDGDIEGCIFKQPTGIWTAEFWIGDSIQKVQIDYCPWCGKELETEVSKRD